MSCSRPLRHLARCCACCLQLHSLLQAFQQELAHATDYAQVVQVLMRASPQELVAASDCVHVRAAFLQKFAAVTEFVV